MSGRIPPPVPPRPEQPKQWVGDETNGLDVSHLSDRAVAIKALDTALRNKTAVANSATETVRVSDALDKHKGEMLRELSNLGRRITILEPPMREESQSSHEWDEMLVKAGRALSQRVKDPRDRMDSDRARDIAKEVFEKAKTAEDAKAFRTWKTRGQKLAFEIAKALVPLVVGAAAGGVFGANASKSAAPQAPAASVVRVAPAIDGGNP